MFALSFDISDVWFIDASLQWRRLYPVYVGDLSHNASTPYNITSAEWIGSQMSEDSESQH